MPQQHFDARWFGDNPRKGLGVLVAKPLRIARTEKPPNRWVVPLSISGGACDFRLIAVWAMPVKGSVVKSYIGQVYEAIAHHPQWFPTKPRPDAPVEAGLKPGLSSSVAQAHMLALSREGPGPSFVAQAFLPVRFSPQILDHVESVPVRSSTNPGNATSAASRGLPGNPDRLIGDSSLRGTGISACALSSPDFPSSNFDFPEAPASPSSTPAPPKPVILCGDFNSNKLWDGHRKTGNHSAVVSLLEKRGLLSAYHHFFSEPQGHETRPTYYFWHRKTRGYHIDYVFLPRAWASRIHSVEVGHHANWSQLSDHVPLSVHVTIPAP